MEELTDLDIWTDKKVLCIKTYSREQFSVETKFTEGEYYLIDTLSDYAISLRNELNQRFISYEVGSFLRYFSTRNLQEVRNDKIKSVIGE